MAFLFLLVFCLFICLFVCLFFSFEAGGHTYFRTLYEHMAYDLVSSLYLGERSIPRRASFRSLHRGWFLPKKKYHFEVKYSAQRVNINIVV